MDSRWSSLCQRAAIIHPFRVLPLWEILDPGDWCQISGWVERTKGRRRSWRPSERVPHFGSIFSVLWRTWSMCRGHRSWKDLFRFSLPRPLAPHFWSFQCLPFALSLFRRSVFCLLRFYLVISSVLSIPYFSFFRLFFFSSSSFQIIIFPESILCSHIFSSFPLMLPFHLPLLYFPVFHLSIFYLSLSHILIFYFPFLFHLSNIHLQAFILVFFHLFPLVLPLLSFPYPELCSLICSYLSFFQFRGAERTMGGAGSLPEGALRKGKRIPRESILMIC